MDNLDIIEAVGPSRSKSSNDDPDSTNASVKVAFKEIEKVGTHTSKLKTLYESISAFTQKHGNNPCQMYLGSPKSNSRSMPTDSDIERTAELIENFAIPYFTHASLCVNLSNPGIAEIGCETIRTDLKLTSRLGGRGVVFHVGKYTTSSVEDALDMMEQSIRTILPDATERCPLLLETPAGQGTELCVKVEDMIAFYERFSIDEAKIFKICIDTAHIHGAGYEPMEYINKWVAIYGVESVGLIHLNDSKVKKGAKVDRHAFIGQGFIGTEKLFEVIKWANKHEISMVIE